MENLIAIVTGLPRSGTSMMMKILETGSMPIITDKIRKADIDNPKGYYEFEKVKNIKEDTSWIAETRGKAFKMVSMLLYDLPKDEEYKIIFMQRNIDEILLSQKRMLERQKPEDNFVVDYEKMKTIYKKHLLHIQVWLEKQRNMKVVYINYNDIIEHPLYNLHKINQFFNDKLDVNKMITVVDTSLYRNRALDP